MLRRTFFSLALLPLLATPIRAADLWHLAGWQARAVVEIAKPSPDAGCDVCGVKILCQGRAQPDGRDYRVLDAAGKAVPFLLAFHDAGRYSLLSFRADNPKGKYFVYFDNPKATRAAEQISEDIKPGSGPPKGAWVPKYGFVLQTWERPKGDNPRSVAAMAKLMAASKAKYGGRYQRRVAEGYNAFGPSDYYISVYRGWVRVPKAGKYHFCTVSNEASFSFLDGKELVHWPGRHTVDRGIHGEVNEEIDLTAGLHYLEYYHEEVTLEQMAFLGWKAPGEMNFGPIPESFYIAAHDGVVKSYESPKGALAHFEPVVTDSVWLAARHEGQYTRVVFRAGANPALPAGTTYEWHFGDGQKASGAQAEHVYLSLGTFAVILTATKGAEKWSAKWPLLIFEIENVTDQFKEGKPKDYAKLAKGYDREKLSAEALKELAFLLAESEDPAGAIGVGKTFVKRFGKDAKLLMLAQVRRLMADCAIRQGEGSLDEAIANYQASLLKEVPAAEKLAVLARLARLLGIERDLPAKGAAVLEQIEKTAKDADLDRAARTAYVRALAAVGDVRLWQGKRGEAHKLYARAEKLQRPIPPQVRAARIGAYPNSLREYVTAGNYGAALDLVDQWDELFPTDKVNGQSIYWRGKVLALRGQPRDAKRYLAWSLRLATGAGFETEARWLLAETLETLGRKDDARRELAKLIATGLRDEFTKKAREKLLKK